MKRAYSRTAMQQRFGTHLTATSIRRVWACVSRNPHASKREMAAALGLSFGAVGGALRFLKDAGYIQFPKGTHRVITEVTP